MLVISWRKVNVNCIITRKKVNATCNNTVGSYLCSCDLGYSGDGMKCSGRNGVFSNE